MTKRSQLFLSPASPACKWGVPGPGRELGWLQMVQANDSVFSEGCFDGFYVARGTSRIAPQPVSPSTVRRLQRDYGGYPTESLSSGWDTVELAPGRLRGRDSVTKCTLTKALPSS